MGAYSNQRERSNFSGEQPVARDFHPGYDMNGNRPNHSDARHVKGDFQAGHRSDSHVAFLDQRIDRLEKLITSFVQNGQGTKRW